MKKKRKKELSYYQKINCGLEYTRLLLLTIYQLDTFISQCWCLLRDLNPVLLALNSNDIGIRPVEQVSSYPDAINQWIMCQSLEAKGIGVGVSM